MSTDPYAALGLTKTATADEIRKAYRKIARDSHPDLNPDDKAAEDTFKAASAAYDFLKDPERRAKFDRGEIDASGAERHERTYYRDYAGSEENPYRRSQRYEDFAEASDIFAEILRQRGAGGTGRGGGQGFAARGRDSHYTLTVPFLEAAKGGATRITLPDGGALEVQIPQGAADGMTLRLRGKGEPGYGGGPAGDALISLTVRPHTLFRRDGNDVLITLPIAINEAVLGAKVTVPTIGGPVSLTVPKGANSGQVLRLRGRGIKGAGAKTAGDQLVELKITMPPKIDDSLAEFMEAWQKTNGYDPRKGLKA